MDRLKILVSAYACNPNKGSEEGVGWSWVSAIAQNHELCVITGDLHRADIEKKVDENPECYQNIRFYYIPRTRWFKLEKICPPAYLWTYKLWQREAYRLGAILLKEFRFDLIHQLTYIGFRVPGHLWKFDIPFVWGPIGGLENTPLRFLPILGLKGSVYYIGRNILNSFHKNVLIFPKRAFRKANGGIISATEGIRKEILKWYQQESEVICEITPPEMLDQNFSVRENGEPLRLTWSGLHLPGKALQLLLLALAILPMKIDWRLDILGQGPCTPKWKRLAEKIGIHEKCTWYGWVARDKALDIVKNSHLFVITSLKDLTSTVLLEALSQGVPVICPDQFGFTNVVTKNCGIKVQVNYKRQFVTDLAIAIKLIAENECKRRELAAGAIKRVEEFTLEKKAAALNRIYNNVVSSITSV